MGKVIADISMSLDGYGTGPDDRPGQGLGAGGEILHYWVMGRPWRYDDEGRRFEPVGVDRKVLSDALEGGASIIGRGMFEAAGAWGGQPPGGGQIGFFVLTHQAPAEWTGPGSPFTFVTDGIESALAQAQAVAGDRDVNLGGGASIIRQYLAAGLVDDLRIHVAPVLLGAGKRLFGEPGDLGAGQIELQRTSVIESPYATHL